MVNRSIGRRDVCPSCGADVHCCMNCAFHDRAASKQCREPAAELVKDKARANFCDFFSLADAGSPGEAPPRDGQTRKALDELFRK